MNLIFFSPLIQLERLVYNILLEHIIFKGLGTNLLGKKSADNPVFCKIRGYPDASALELA